MRDGSRAPLGTRIGTATRELGIRIVDASGRPVPLPARAGFDHFGAR
jgi:hypothetical protein